MLTGRPLVAFVLVGEAGAAKAFYCDVLGLPLVSEDPFAVVVDAGGTTLRLAVVDAVPEPAGTNAGWSVDDVNGTARSLVEAGITFERFDGMDQDDDGVWHPGGPGSGAGVAWFRDPFGNRLSLSG